MTTTPTASPELLDLDKLEALARAATPGRWMRLFGERTVYDRMEDGCRGNAIVRADLGYGLQDISNLDFIAAANPAAVLALVALARRGQPEGEAPQAAPFQHRVQPWMMACFGAEISADKVERNDRFTEESLELGQACGMTKDRVLALVDYVYDRPLGEPAQEVGGVMVTLAALCLAQGLDMHEAAEVELARIWTKVEAIRAKQLTKPRGSPLPIPAASLSPLCGAQHAESGAEGQPVWIVNDDRGEHVMMCPQKPAAEDMENLAAKIERNVIVPPFVLYPAAQQAAAPAPAVICHPTCFWGDCPPCVEAGVAPSAPGTPEAPSTTCMTEEQAESWAWKQVKLDVGTDGWTAGDSCNYFGFFLWGWRYRAQYERQRAAQLDGGQEGGAS